MNNQPRGQKPSPTGNDWEDDSGPWRHAPVAPRDAGVADSLGKSVSDVVTGPLEGEAGKAKRPPAAPTPAKKP